MLPIRVVKVGGSLLGLPDLAKRIRDWLGQQSPAHHVLLVGGGPLADQIRQWDQQHVLPEDAAHWLCVDLLDVTAGLLHARLPEIALVGDDRMLCQRVGERNCTIFAPARWLRESEPQLPGTRLPATWDVTSDSIAARLAVVLGASELVLLKSVLPNVKLGPHIENLAAVGYVDPMLSRLGPELPILRLIGLRANPHAELAIPALGSLG